MKNSTHKSYNIQVHSLYIEHILRTLTELGFQASNIGEYRNPTPVKTHTGGVIRDLG